MRLVFVTNVGQVGQATAGRRRVAEAGGSILFVLGLISATASEALVEDERPGEPPMTEAGRGRG